MYQYAARFVRAVDGDTVGLDLDLGFYQWRLGRTYRLARLDAAGADASTSLRPRGTSVNGTRSG